MLFDRCKNCKYYKPVQELVERATPKRLIATKRTRRCPSCNRQMSDINNTHPNIKFCQNCGQALDWEDKKENVRNQEVE